MMELQAEETRKVIINGDIEEVRIHFNYLKLVPDRMSLAIHRNDIEIVKIIHCSSPDQEKDNIMSTACTVGNYEIFVFLYEKKYKIDENNIIEIIEHDHLEIITYLFNSCIISWDIWSINMAAYYGKLRILKFLIKNGTAIDVWKCTRSIIQANQLECLRYIANVFGITKQCIYDVHSGTEDNSCTRFIMEYKGDIIDDGIYKWDIVKIG